MEELCEFCGQNEGDIKVDIISRNYHGGVSGISMCNNCADTLTYREYMEKAEQILQGAHHQEFPEYY